MYLKKKCEPKACREGINQLVNAHYWNQVKTQ